MSDIVDPSARFFKNDRQDTPILFIARVRLSRLQGRGEQSSATQLTMASFTIELAS
jgi:hypothetical protein